MGAALQSETDKLREQKDENERYKEFLVKLTPPEWKHQQEEEKKARKARRRQNFIDERMGSILEKFAKEEEAAVEKTMLEQADRGGRQGARQGRKKQEEDENNQREKERQLRRRKYEKQRAEAEKRISEEFKDVSSEE